MNQWVSSIFIHKVIGHKEIKKGRCQGDFSLKMYPTIFLLCLVLDFHCKLNFDFKHVSQLPCAVVKKKPLVLHVGDPWVQFPSVTKFVPVVRKQDPLGLVRKMSNDNKCHSNQGQLSVVMLI